MLIVTSLRFGLVIALAALAASQFRSFLPADNPRNGTCRSSACHTFVPGNGIDFR